MDNELKKKAILLVNLINKLNKKKLINSESNFWLQAIKLKNKKEKNFLQNFLYKSKIQTRSIWRSNHLFFYLKKYPKMNLDNSLKLYAL